MLSFGRSEIATVIAAFIIVLESGIVNLQWVFLHLSSLSLSVSATWFEVEFSSVSGKIRLNWVSKCKSRILNTKFVRILGILNSLEALWNASAFPKGPD